MGSPLAVRWVLLLVCPVVAVRLSESLAFVPQAWLAAPSTQVLTWFLAFSLLVVGQPEQPVLLEPVQLEPQLPARGKVAYAYQTAMESEN
jgi:hypothetical protein